MTRVCLYTRISTDEENQPTSLHFAARTTGSFLQGSRGGGGSSPQKQDQATGHEARPTGTAGGARARALSVRSICCSFIASTA